jgi:hypothetical protein
VILKKLNLVLADQSENLLGVIKRLIKQEDWMDLHQAWDQEREKHFWGAAGFPAGAYMLLFDTGVLCIKSRMQVVIFAFILCPL